MSTTPLSISCNTQKQFLTAVTKQFSPRHEKSLSLPSAIKDVQFQGWAEGVCVAHPLPAEKWRCFGESDEYFNF